MSKKEKKSKLNGIFRANSKGFGFVQIEGREEEVFISSKNINGALDGDTVTLAIIKEKNKDRKAEAKITKIVKREKDTVVGIFQKSRNFGFVVPDDKKFATDIFISKNKCKNAKTNDKVIAKITKYPEKGKNAEGEIIEVLGNINQAGIDMLSVIKEFDIPNEFPSFVIEEAKNIKQEIDKNDIKNRRDFREDIIFTIDGEDAKDLDDAISVSKNENGNYNLNVHIADVSYYVKENSKLDKEAIKRGTSVYMFDRVIPMLPFELSNGICSLNQGEDRFAITVLMEINQNGKVVSSDIQKSIINVTRRMSYKEVQAILNENEGSYFSHFKRMEELANILKERRKIAGSLELDIPESKIILDKHGIAVDVKKYEMYFTNELIEQFMLTANETVAEKFYWLEAPFIYRVHEVPDMEKIEELNKFLWNLGYKIKGSKDNIHPKAFAEVLEEIQGKPEERVVSNLVLRTLKIARYENENKGHFGIASKYYCHFTSPIRRYPDLFIHRIISRYLENNYQLSDEQLEKYQEQSLRYAESSSDREKIAQKVERDAEDIKKAEFMQDKIGEEYDGIISSITSFGVFVELENTVEGLIRFDDLGDEYFIYDENKKTLQSEKSKKMYKIGDSIRIRVIFADKLTRRIDFQLAVGN